MVKKTITKGKKIITREVIYSSDKYFMLIFNEISSKITVMA